MGKRREGKDMIKGGRDQMRGSGGTSAKLIRSMIYSLVICLYRNLLYCAPNYLLLIIFYVGK